MDHVDILREYEDHELLAHCHSDRSSHVGASTPNLMCWLDCEPSESFTDYMTDGYTFLQDRFEPIVCPLPTSMEVVDESYRVGANKRQKLMSSLQ